MCQSRCTEIIMFEDLSIPENILQVTDGGSQDYENESNTNGATNDYFTSREDNYSSCSTDDASEPNIIELLPRPCYNPFHSPLKDILHGL